MEQAWIDTRHHFKGILVGVLSPAVLASLIVPEPNASMYIRVGTAIAFAVSLILLVFLVALAVAPVRQRNAADRRVVELESQKTAEEDRDGLVRQLVALRRDFLKNSPGLNDPVSSRAVPQSIIDALVARLVDAQSLVQPVSSEFAGEFGDLAQILDEQHGISRQAVAALQRDGKLIFDRAISRW